MSTPGERDTLHRLVDQLRPEEDVATASHPLLTALSNAPVDDAPETDAEREAVERARKDVRDGSTLARGKLAFFAIADQLIHTPDPGEQKRLKEELARMTFREA